MKGADGYARMDTAVHRRPFRRKMEGKYMEMRGPLKGWNSWNTFGENINEKMIFETADVMAESGLRDKGYEYLVIDDCWSLRERDENVLCRIRENFRTV